MIVIRSFDVNKPGAEVDHISGGVAGGSITQVGPEIFPSSEFLPAILLIDMIVCEQHLQIIRAY